MTQGTPPSRPRKRTGPLVAGALLVLLAFGLAGFTVWQVFFSAEGGAESPEAAVTELFEAGAEQDGVAALRLLNPDEVRGADEVWESVQERMDDAEMVEDGEVTGTHIAVEDVDVEVEELSDHAAKVTVTGGTVAVTVDVDQLPPRLADLAEGAAGEQGSTYTEEMQLVEIRELLDLPADPFLIAIEDDGRWFVSPTATVAEYVALATTGHGGDWSAYEAGLERDPATAAEPEEALSVLADSFALDDLHGFADALPPGQAAVLRPYLGFLEDALLDEGLPELRASFDGADVAAGAERDGLVRLDLEQVRFDLAAVGSTGGSAAGLDGMCGWAESISGQRVEGCLPEEVARATGEDNVFVMVRETAGGWQLDPLATVIAWSDAAVRHISSEDLEALLQLVA